MKPKDPWWLPDAATPPCVFDIDLHSVDTDAPWVKISTRHVTKDATAENSLFSLRHFFTQHPVLRTAISPDHTLHLTSSGDVPKWIRERIAVLNMADVDTLIIGVGKRWSSSMYAKAKTWILDTESLGALDRRFYTLDWNCERLEW
jgi:hypothetical protein